MTYKVGIPRALLYHQFSTLWHTFFNCLDVEVIVSGETNKFILDQGAARVVDEACLPVKIFFGHVAQLAQEKPDFLYIPRLVSIEKKAYICPKIMGLPDMLEAGKTPVPPLIKPTLNLVSGTRIHHFLWETASCFTTNRTKIKKAWRKAEEEQKKVEEGRIQEGRALTREAQAAQVSGSDYNRLTALLLGHHYMIYDRYLNLNIMEKLKKLGCRVLTPDHLPEEMRERAVRDLPKSLFWTYGKALLGSAFCFSRFPGPKGVIILTSFGCGIDSFVCNMIMRFLRRVGIPYLNITLDEHTGEAGVDTRIEAFLDMIRWRRVRDEDYIPTHGPHLGTPEGTAGIPGACSHYAAPYQ